MSTVPKVVIKAFGVSATPVLLRGGQGTTYRCGDVILKPTNNVVESEWIAETFSQIGEHEAFRLPKPIKSLKGKWVSEGWAAWTYISGETIRGSQYQERFEVCNVFHRTLRDIPRPDFLDDRDDPWAIADRVAWQEVEADYNEDFMSLINKIGRLMKPVDLSNQIIHGDMLGNIMLDDNLPPAIIDFSVYFRPVEFARAVMVADAITWEGADVSMLKYMDKDQPVNQLILRAILRRIVEQAEHIRQSNKDVQEALAEAKQYQKAINLLTC